MYNTFPDMNGTFAPAGMLEKVPAWINLFENPVTAQFVHRVLGWLVLVGALGNLILGLKNRVTGTQKLIHWSLFLSVIGQFLLGVMTLLMSVPVKLASLHQAGAGVVLLLAVTNLYLEHRAIKDRIGV